MKRTYKTATMSIITVLLVTSLTSASCRKNHLTEEQAVAQAQHFIIDNGYTNLPADKSKIKYELFDKNYGNVDSILKHRHNTLHPSAFCISEDNEKWNVGFLSTNIDPSNLDSLQRQGNLRGRAVILMKNGSEVRMAHKDPLFSYFRKL